MIPGPLYRGIPSLTVVYRGKPKVPLKRSPGRPLMPCEYVHRTAPLLRPPPPFCDLLPRKRGGGGGRNSGAVRYIPQIGPSGPRGGGGGGGAGRVMEVI